MWAAPVAPGSRHPDAQHRITIHRFDTVDEQRDIGIRTAAL